MPARRSQSPDLDGDGDPEIISTLDVLPPTTSSAPERASDADALVVSSWHVGERLCPRARAFRSPAACERSPFALPTRPGLPRWYSATPGEICDQCR